MIIVAIIMAYMLGCMYAIVSGIKDSVLWSKKGSLAYKWNEHIIFAIERSVVFSTLIPATLFTSFWDFTVVIIADMLAFSFWHNGFYYIGRKKIDSPPGYNFTYTADTSNITNSIDFSWGLRCKMKLISVICILTYCVYIYNSL